MPNRWGGREKTEEEEDFTVNEEEEAFFAFSSSFLFPLLRCTVASSLEIGLFPRDASSEKNKNRTRSLTSGVDFSEKDLLLMLGKISHPVVDSCGGRSIGSTQVHSK